MSFAKGLLTTAQVAEKLGLHRTRINAMIRAGRLPAEKIGRDYFIKEEDLKLIENRKPGRPRKAQSAETSKREVKKKAGKKK